MGRKKVKKDTKGKQKNARKSATTTRTTRTTRRKTKTRKRQCLGKENQAFIDYLMQRIQNHFSNLSDELNTLTKDNLTKGKIAKEPDFYTAYETKNHSQRLGIVWEFARKNESLEDINLAMQNYFLDLKSFQCGVAVKIFVEQKKLSIYFLYYDFAASRLSARKDTCVPSLYCCSQNKLIPGNIQHLVAKFIENSFSTKRIRVDRLHGGDQLIIPNQYIIGKNLVPNMIDLDMDVVSQFLSQFSTDSCE